MNFIGVIVGGISVADALVELLPPDVLSPPDGLLIETDQSTVAGDVRDHDSR
jgi:hypothetical protein